ncbi:MAG: TetR/AcrR family transcriptional regulator [Sporichthyaceae bacterium]
MTEIQPRRATTRRVIVEREILDAAWMVMAQEGVAALSVREVARSVGLRQQSLTHYFPTKADLLDALFVDGFGDLQRTFDRLRPRRDHTAAVVDVAVAYVDYCVAHPARYHLMFQGTVPGFEPREQSHRVALGVLAVLIERLAAAGVTAVADLAIVRSLMSGIAAEQIANDPHGRSFAGETERAIRYLLAGLTADSAKRPTHRRR